MNGLGIAAGVVCVIAGVMELMFSLFMGLYALMFGLVGIASAFDSKGEIGGVIVGGGFSLVLGAFVFLVVIAAILHIVAAIGIFRNKPSKPIMWAATVGSLIPMCTVYCAAISLPAGILMLVYLLADQSETPDPDILV